MATHSLVERLRLEAGGCRKAPEGPAREYWLGLAGILDEAADSLERMQWVPCIERLPEPPNDVDPVRVLACGAGVAGVFELHYYTDYGFLFPDDALFDANRLVGIEFWQPIPPPPKSGE